jgi:hypothetical protein
MVGPRDVNIELLRYRSLAKYQPRVGDFIIFTGWFSRWYGVASAVDKGELTIIKDGLPSLLFTMDESDYAKNSIKLGLGGIINSSPGAYSVLQDGVWHSHG